MLPPKVRRALCAFNFHFHKVGGGLPCIHTVIPGIKRALRNPQTWVHTACVPSWDHRLPATPFLQEYYGRVRASRFYCHCEDPVMIFRELASHSLIGCVASGVLYKSDSFMGEMGMEESAGNVAVGKKREQELPEVE